MSLRILDYDGETMILAAARDISRRIALENQLRQTHKLEAVGTLAGGIAHDINNILGIIIGNTELALVDVPGESDIRNF